MRASARHGSELNALGQTAHQAAIADGRYWPYNTDSSWRAFRNVHASFWFFHWHRGHLLAIEAVARANGMAQSWTTPYWNITAPGARDVARHVLQRYAPDRSLSSNWTYRGPDEEALLSGSLAELVGELSLGALHSWPHEWFRLSGAQVSTGTAPATSCGS